MVAQTQKTITMKFTITKTYDNPNAARGYKGKLGNLIPISPYHSEGYTCKIGAITIAFLSFANGKLDNFDLKTDKTSSDGTSIYFYLIGKSYDEVISILNAWLEE
jgi:hypothetical protein